MEGDHIKINRWLLPFSWLYGLAVIIRNELFELNILKTRRFDIPVISVGNITVGGGWKDSSRGISYTAAEGQDESGSALTWI